MSTINMPMSQRDEIYYWDNICFSVEGCLFKVPRLPFIVGSEYFADKYGLRTAGEGDTTAGAEVSVTQLDGVRASQFRLFLKLLLPLLPRSATHQFHRDEWLEILDLSTFWRFPDIRVLAIQQLDSQLSTLSLIGIGRTIFYAGWVLEGYKRLVLKPKLDIISEDEATIIGHETACKLWIIRYQSSVSGAARSVDFVERELRSRFAQELADLQLREDKHFRRVETDGEVSVSDREWRLEGEKAGVGLDVAGMEANRETERGLGSKPDVVGGEQAAVDPERQRRLEEEEQRINRVKKSLLLRKSKLLDEEAMTANALAKKERLLNNPGNCTEKTVGKRQRKHKKLQSTLATLKSEIKDVLGLLNQLGEEEERLRKEKLSL